jgi:hypothetical protein
MGYYSVPGFITTMSTSFKSAGTVTPPASATRRIKVFEMIMGATVAPNSTDCNVEMDLSRVTSTGTGAGTSWTPTQSDAADGAATSTSVIAYTTEPQTITSNSTLYKIGMNQRATVRWIAAQESQYLTCAASSGSGLVLRGLCGTGFNSSWGGQMTFME